MVLLIGYLPNPRMNKRIELEKADFELHLICWDRAHNMHVPPRENGYRLHTITIPALSNPIRREIPYLRFSARAMKLLREIRPEVIHVQGLDMLKIAVRYKRRYEGSVRILYEIPDLHPLQIDPQDSLVGKLCQRYIWQQDRKYCRQIDRLIVTSEKFVDAYYGRFVPQEKVFFFPNVPEPEIFADYKKRECTGALTVGFIGILLYKKQLLHLLEASEKSGVNVLMAGLENEPAEVEPVCRSMTNVEWVGRYDFTKQAAELYGKCDVIFCVYEVERGNVRILLPNKLYEAVFCELPIIVAKGTYLAEIVEQWGVGVAVDHNSSDEMERVLRRMNEDRDYYRAFVENCRAHKKDVELAAYNARLREILLGC